MANKTIEEVWNASNRVSQNNKQFNDALMDLADAVEDNFNELFLSTIFLTFGDIAKNTPRDTGIAQGNWQIGNVTNDKQLDNTEIIDPSSKKLDPTKTIYIFNNLPYIEQLEAGSSIAQGGHMVANALNNSAAYARQVVKNLNGLK